MSAVKRVEFVSNMMMNVILCSQWCNISALNVKTPTAKKSGNIRTVSLGTQGFHIRKLQCKNGHRRYFKTMPNVNLHETINNNGAQSSKRCYIKICIKCTVSPSCNTYKYKLSSFHSWH